MAAVTDREARARAERIRRSIHRNGSSNGSSPDPEINAGEINVGAVMKEWLESSSKTREALIEDELDNILLVVETAFSFGWGAAPNDLECKLCEGGDKNHMEICEKAMLWNYQEFAKTISERAKKLNITTQKLIARALEPLKDGKGNVRQRVLEQLFGGEQNLIEIARRKNI